MSQDAGAGWGLKELGRTCAMAGTGIALCLLLVLVGALVSLGWSTSWVVALLVVLGVLAAAAGTAAGLMRARRGPARTTALPAGVTRRR